MARDYLNIGSVQFNLNDFGQALDYYVKALGIDEGTNDRVGMARDYWGIGIVLKGLNQRKEAAESVKKGLKVLLELEKETGYHHPLIETFKEIKKSLKDRSA